MKLSKENAPKLLCALRSDFGAINCVKFDKSGRILAVGGESDTIVGK